MKKEEEGIGLGSNLKMYDTESQINSQRDSKLKRFITGAFAVPFNIFSRKSLTGFDN